MKSYPNVFSLLGIPDTLSRAYGFDEPENRALYQAETRDLPNGNHVNVLKWISGELSEAEIEACKKDIESYYGGEVINQATNKYNCHAFAWHIYQAHDTDEVWMDEPDTYWKTGCYYE